MNERNLFADPVFRIYQDILALRQKLADLTVLSPLPQSEIEQIDRVIHTLESEKRIAEIEKRARRQSGTMS